jgi:cell division protein FtsQ
MFGIFAAKRSRISATKVEHQPLSQKIWRIIKYYLFLPVFLLAILYAWQYLQHHQLFPVENVTVIDTAAHVDPKTVKAIALPDVESGFFRFSVESLQEQLTNIPWVQQASVTREWPNKLVIEFTEYKPVARWDNTALIAANGTVFSPGSYAKMPTNLPVLNGPNAEASNVLAHYEIMQHMLAPLHLQIKEIDVSNRLAWNLLLSNGMRINLGEQHPIDRLQAFIAVYPQIFAQSSEIADYVDMRYDHGMAVHWEKQGKEPS